MGTVSKRKRKDGSFGYTAQIRIKRNKIVVYTESETFEREAIANNWLKKRESELAAPGALDAVLNPVQDPTFADAIDKYLADTKRNIGKTKAQVLRTIKAAPIGKLKCSQITSQALVSYISSMITQPSTRGNYFSHIGSVMRVAKPAWGYPLDSSAYKDALIVLKHMRLIAPSKDRDRRPNLEELNQLMEYFGASRSKRVDSVPMQEIVLYAIFSTRRQEEITRQCFEDLQEASSKLWVRDMKHPGEKVGNDVLTALPQQALALVLRRRSSPDQKGRIFPFHPGTISGRFTNACIMLGIEDLHFHDLRHDGISRLFEMGNTIPQVAAVSGHRSWNSLKRYTHLEQSGDKYAGWSWLDKFGIAPAKPKPEDEPSPMAA